MTLAKGGCLVGKLKQRLAQVELWQRNLVVLWFGCFMTGIGA